MYLTDEADAPRKPTFLSMLWHWILVILFGCFALMMVTPGKEIDAPGVPLAIYWSAVASLVLATVITSPPVYFRLPRFGKFLSYAGLVGAFCFSGYALGETQAAYDRTPEGKKEKAEAKAQEVAHAKAEKEWAAREAEMKEWQAEEDRKAEQNGVCESLVPQVVEMASSERGVEIIEVNNVFASSEKFPGRSLTCFADAITSVGNKSITFGLEKTPQGQVLVTLQMRR